MGGIHVGHLCVLSSLPTNHMAGNQACHLDINATYNSLCFAIVSRDILAHRIILGLQGR